MVYDIVEMVTSETYAAVMDVGTDGEAANISSVSSDEGTMEHSLA